ncbi:MAG: hypothetical protein RBR53_07815 [Desulforegulaceae bacterium]|nr:hypothetical protein [Desulforegulaceae bacterium]
MKTKIIISIALASAIAIAGLIIFNQTKKPTPQEIYEKDTKKEIKVPTKAMISIKNSDDLKLMKKRKEEYGVEKGLDMVLKSDEKTKINGQVIDLKSIEEQDKVLRGDFVSTDLKINEKITPKDYGLYLVKKGDNLWTIHFRLLKELFAKKGVTLSDGADQPLNGGYSSGVGKILKFSEETVSVYSLETGKLTKDINILEPEGKVVIYKMTEIIELLDDISMANIKNVVFDGKNLWIDSVNSQDN